MAAFGVKSAPSVATKHELTLTTRMDIVYASGNCH